MLILGTSDRHRFPLDWQGSDQLCGFAKRITVTVSGYRAFFGHSDERGTTDHLRRSSSEQFLIGHAHGGVRPHHLPIITLPMEDSGPAGGDLPPVSQGQHDPTGDPNRPSL